MVSSVSADIAAVSDAAESVAAACSRESVNKRSVYLADRPMVQCDTAVTAAWTEEPLTHQRIATMCLSSAVLLQRGIRIASTVTECKRVHRGTSRRPAGEASELRVYIYDSRR